MKAIISTLNIKNITSEVNIKRLLHLYSKNLCKFHKSKFFFSPQVASTSEVLLQKCIVKSAAQVECSNRFWVALLA